MDRSKKLHSSDSFVDDSGKKKDAETNPSGTQHRNKIRTLFQWHPWSRHLVNFVDEHPTTFYHERKTEETPFCSDCNLPIDGAIYCCLKCKNFLHKACAEFPKKIIHPFDRSHPLLRVHDLDFNRNTCSGCILPIRGKTAYSCKECNLYFDKFCLELPERIEHPRHPSHSLSLNHDTIGSSSRESLCTACSNHHKGLSYRCKHGHFNLGLACVGLEATSPKGNQGHILSFLGEQPWDFAEDECLTCGRGFRSESVFRCHQGKFSLHSECVLQTTMSVLPRRSRIENHVHALNLISGAEEFERAVPYCDICKKPINPKHKFYRCSKCNFNAHFGCALPVEAGEISNSDSELPPSAEGNFHSHPLFLTESNNSGHVSHSSFFCGVCGTAGDITVAFYACHQDDCYLAVHLKCVLIQLKLSFAHKLDYAVLDTTPVVITNPSPTVAEIIESIPDEDKQKLRDALKATTTEKVRGTTINNPHYKYHDHQNITGSNHDHEPLDQIITRFGSKCQAALRYYEPKSQVIFVQEKYIISTDLAPVLRSLVSRYGDFSRNSPLTQIGKTFVFMVLCAALYSICTTKEGEMTEIQLFICSDSFKIAQEADFEVAFSFKRLRKAIHGFFGLGNANASTDEALAELDPQMDALAREMESLEEICGKRMTSLLSNLIDANDTIEIVGKIEGNDSWDSDELKTRGEISISDWAALRPIEEIQVGTREISPSSEALFEGEADGPRSLVEQIESFIEKHPLKMSISYFASKYYSLFKEKSDEIVCYKCKQIVENPIRGCIACSESSELPSMILHDFHDHPLTNKEIMDKSLCSACSLPISYANYHCGKCNISMHKFCVQFPAKIECPPLHPAHVLSLEGNSEKLQKTTCNSCGEKIKGWAFSCLECKFYLDIQCLFSVPTVQSLTHGKLLLFTKKREIPNVHPCFTCRKRISGPPFLRCVSCNVSLHIQCAQLPSIIYCTFDDHPLTLTRPDSGKAEGSPGSFRCKLCKKQRIGPLLPTYSCEECKVAAHIDCVTRSARN